MLSLTECVRDFHNDAFWDTQKHAQLVKLMIYHQDSMNASIAMFSMLTETK